MERLVNEFLVIVDDPELPVDPRAAQHSRLILLLSGLDPDDPDLQDLVTILNDWWCLSWGFIHNCGNCAERCDKQVLAANLVRVIYRVFLSCRPEIPLASRWTRVFSCLQWFNPFMSCHGMYQKLFRMCFDSSFASERVQEVAAAAVDLEEGDNDGEADAGAFISDRDKYQKELGKRKARGVLIARDVGMPCSVLLATLILGPLHYSITHQLHVRKMRSEKAADADCPAPIVDIMNPATSWVTMVMQHFSHLLMRPATDSHLCVLSGFFETYKIPHNLLIEIQRLILGAAGSLFYRFVDRIQRKYPWLWFRTLDERLTRAERIEPAQQAAKLYKCCVDDGATDVMIRQIEVEHGELEGFLDFNHFLEDDWQVLLLQVAKEIDGAISDLEDRNARNKNQAEPGQTSEMLCAKYTIAEAKANKNSYCKSSQATVVETVSRQTDGSKSKHEHALLAFHRHRVKTLADMGVGVSSASSEAWGVTRSDWELLSAEECELWEIRAELANSGATQLVVRPEADLAEAAHTIRHPFGETANALAVPNEVAKEWSGNYPISEQMVESQGNPKKRAAEFIVRAGLPVPFQFPAHSPKAKVCCQDTGVCRRKWSEAGWPYAKFVDFVDRQKVLMAQLQASQAALGLRNSGLILKLIAYDGYVAGDLAATYFAWVTFRSDHPIFEVYTECVCVPAAPTRPPYPFTVQPATEMFYQSQLGISQDRFFSDIGSMKMHMSHKWAAKLLTDPRAPINDSVWVATPMKYTSPCEETAAALPAEMLVTGPGGESVTLKKTKQTKKQQASGSGPEWDLLSSFDHIKPPRERKASSKPSGRVGRAKSKAVPVEDIRVGEGGEDMPKAIADASVDEEDGDAMFVAEAEGEEEPEEEEDGDATLVEEDLDPPRIDVVPGDWEEIALKKHMDIIKDTLAIAENIEADAAAEERPEAPEEEEAPDAPHTGSSSSSSSSPVSPLNQNRCFLHTRAALRCHATYVWQ